MIKIIGGILCAIFILTPIAIITLNQIKNTIILNTKKFIEENNDFLYYRVLEYYNANKNYLYGIEKELHKTINLKMVDKKINIIMNDLFNSVTIDSGLHDYALINCLSVHEIIRNTFISLFSSEMDQFQKLERIGTFKIKYHELEKIHYSNCVLSIPNELKEKEIKSELDESDVIFCTELPESKIVGKTYVVVSATCTYTIWNYDKRFGRFTPDINEMNVTDMLLEKIKPNEIENKNSESVDIDDISKRFITGIITSTDFDSIGKYGTNYELLSTEEVDAIVDLIINQPGKDIYEKIFYALRSLEFKYYFEEKLSKITIDRLYKLANKPKEFNNHIIEKDDIYDLTKSVESDIILKNY